ncbi:MAG: hypothetical protein AMXMBFR33_01420 [Candidatus Xenobia bacterium]
MAVFRLEAVFDVLTGKAVSQLRDMEKSTESAAAKVKRLEQQLEKTRAVADRKAAQIAKLEKAVAAGGTGAEKAAAKLDKMRKSLEDTQARAGQLSSQLGAARSQMNSFGGQLERVSAMALRFAGPAVLGALSAALIKLGADAVVFGTQLHDAMARFRSQTGASAGEAKRFEGALISLHRNNTNSIEALGGALQAMRREFRDIGNDLVPVTQAFLDFAKVHQTDVRENINTTRDLLDAWGLSTEQVQPILDRLTVAARASGASVDQLGTTLQRGQGVFAAAGLSFDESLALLTQFDVSNSEAALKGLTNMMGALREPTDKQASALKRLGVELDQFGRPVNGARSVLAALFRTFGEGKGSAAQMDAAMDLLSKKVANDFVRGIRQGKGEFEGLLATFSDSAGATKQAAAAWDEQFGERWELLKRKHFDPSIAGMGQGFLMLSTWLLDLVDKALTAIGQIGQALGHMATELEGTFTQLFGGVQDLFVGLVAVIKGALADLLDSLAVAMDQLPGLVKDQLGTLQQDTQKVAGLLRQGNQQDLARGEQGGNRFFEGLKGVGRLVTGNTFLDALVKTENAKTPTPEIAGPKSDATPLQAPGKVAQADDSDALAARQRQRTQDALKDLEFFVARKRALHELSTQQELALLEQVLQSRKFGQTQLVLEKDEERKLELDIARLRGQLLKEAEGERKKQADERKKAADAAKKLESDLAIEVVRLTQGETAAKIAELDRQKAEYLKVAQDKALVEAWYHGERKKLEDEANKELLDKRKDLTKQLEDATLQAEGKEREIKVRAILETVQKAREAGVDEETIARFVAAEKKKLLDQEKADVQSTVDAEKAARRSLLGSREQTTGGVYDPGDVAGAFANFGAPSDSFTGFASSKRAATGKSGDLTDAQVSGALDGALTSAGNLTAPKLPVPDLSAPANAAVGAAAKGASFSPINQRAAAEAAAQAGKPKLEVVLSGGVVVEGELLGPDGEKATIQGFLDSTGMQARLMGDAPAIPGLA